MAQVMQFKCPNCGDKLTPDMTECPSCYGPVFITTFDSVNKMSTLDLNKYAFGYNKALSEDPNNIDLNTSVAMCYLKLKLYDKAIPAFGKATDGNFENSEAYFYAAVAMLQGKKAFVHQRPTIDKILEYLNAAIMIEPRGIYYYFMAYIKYDYFARKYFNVSPNYQEVLKQAVQTGVSPHDANQLFELLGVEKPSCLQI